MGVWAIERAQPGACFVHWHHPSICSRYGTFEQKFRNELSSTTELFWSFTQVVHEISDLDLREFKELGLAYISCIDTIRLSAADTELLSKRFCNQLSSTRCTKVSNKKQRCYLGKRAGIPGCWERLCWKTFTSAGSWTFFISCSMFVSFPQWLFVSDAASSMLGDPWKIRKSILMDGLLTACFSFWCCAW